MVSYYYEEDVLCQEGMDCPNYGLSSARSFVAGSLSSKVFVLQYKSTIGIQTVNNVIGRLGVGRDSCSQKWKFRFHAWYKAERGWNGTIFSSNIRLGRFLALITRPLGGQQLPTLGRPYNNSTTVRGLPLYWFEVIWTNIWNSNCEILIVQVLSYSLTCFPNALFYPCKGLNVIPDFNEMKCQCSGRTLANCQISTNGVCPSQLQSLHCCVYRAGQKSGP